MFRTLLLSVFFLFSACSDQTPTDSPETDAPNQADLSSAAPRNAGLAYEAPLFIAFPPENPDAAELANLLDSGLARLTANGRLAAILSAYRLSDPDL